MASKISKNFRFSTHKTDLSSALKFRLKLGWIIDIGGTHFVLKTIRYVFIISVLAYIISWRGWAGKYTEDAVPLDHFSEWKREIEHKLATERK